MIGCQDLEGGMGVVWRGSEEWVWNGQWVSRTGWSMAIRSRSAYIRSQATSKLSFTFPSATMKVVAVLALCLVQVGSVLAIPHHSDTTQSTAQTDNHKSSTFVDFEGYCASSGEYTQLQREMAVLLWNYDPSKTSHAKTHLQEHHHGSHAFRITVTYNRQDGEFKFSLTTEVLDGVVPGICISSGDDDIHVNERQQKHVLPWLKMVQQALKVGMPASLLKMYRYGRFPSPLDGVLALVQAYDGGRTDIISKLVNLIVMASDSMASAHPKFVIHVVPPFSGIVLHRGPVLEMMMEEMKKLYLDPEERMATELNELVGQVIMPQLLTDMIPLLPDMVTMDVPQSFVKEGLLIFQETFEFAVLPTLVNITLGTHEVVDLREIMFTVTQMFNMIY